VRDLFDPLHTPKVVDRGGSGASGKLKVPSLEDTTELLRQQIRRTREAMAGVRS
jgi:hypothetical protein